MSVQFTHCAAPGGRPPDRVQGEQALRPYHPEQLGQQFVDVPYMLGDEVPQDDGERTVTEGQGLPERGDRPRTRRGLVRVRRVDPDDIQPLTPEG